MLYLILKTLHVVSALLFLGVGLGSAWYKLRADRSGDLRVIVWCQREIVLADWLFTTPSAVILPATGLAMALDVGIPLSTPWIAVGLIGFAVSGALWLPAVVLQLRMRRAADHALQNGTALPSAFYRDRRAWFALGVPAFLISALMIWIMVSKTVPFWH